MTMKFSTLKASALKASAAAALGGVLLTACGIAPSTTPSGQVAFPDPSHAWMKRGDFVDVTRLRLVRPGLDKRQVYSLIGPPHFNEGVIAVHVWNYLFDFRLRSGAIAQCQYQIQYGSDMRIKATYWRNPNCEALVNPAPPPPPAPVPAPAPVVQHITLNGDVSFDTDRAELKPAARSTLDSLIARTGDETFSTVAVDGYTDSTGSVRYNQRLSERRASSVANYLQQHGLRAQRYKAHGYGKSNPVASNATAQGRARNRRVEVLLEQ